MVSWWTVSGSPCEPRRRSLLHSDGPEAEIVERFVGRSAAHMQQEIERQLGRSIDWGAEFEPRYREVFERELDLVPGIVEALDAITTPVCVVSSGSHDKMRFTLGKTGLFDRFDGRMFSADQVEHGKPAPDIFLFAATQMGATPGRCAVVEDSVSGVRAALAAEMTAFAFVALLTDPWVVHAAARPGSGGQ
jgi:HAD superfamily hydrolase (TIGR01509 family)